MADINAQLGGAMPPEQQPKDFKQDYKALLDAEAMPNTPKEKDGKATADTDVFLAMLMTGSNSNGMAINKKPEENTKPEAVFKFGKEIKTSAKYTKSFQERLQENPKMMIWTPKGKMLVKEAMRKGYNPLTHTFEEEKDMDAIKQKHLNEIEDEEERKKVEEILSRKGKVAKKDAKQYGLDEDDEMVNESIEGQASAQEETGPVQAAPVPEGKEDEATMASLMHDKGGDAKEAEQGPLAFLGGGK